MPTFKRHIVMTSIIVLWALSLVTWVTYIAFTDPPDIPTGTAAVMATIYGLPALAFGLWKWKGDAIRKD